MRVSGFDSATMMITWDDGALTVIPPVEQERIEQAFAKPIDVWRSVEDVDQGRIDEVLERLEPGTAEHAARAILALPGGLLLEGDDAIPADDADEEPDVE